MSVTDEVLSDAGVNKPPKESVATRIVKIAHKARVTPFRDPHHVPYVAKGREVFSFDGGGVRSLLGRLLFRAESRVPGRTALDDAVEALRSEALYGSASSPSTFGSPPCQTASPSTSARATGPPPW